MSGEPISFPAGFLGTRADLLFDLIIVSILFITPTILFSWSQARKGRYLRHKRLQILLTLILTVVLILFEMNLKAKGGIFVLTRESRFSETWVLPTALFVHLFFAISTAVIWVSLLISSLLIFPHPPTPNAFSSSHRFWGRIAILDLILTAVTAVILYAVGFVY